ncbi:MAG: catalase [Thermoleophilaceae bacterium]|nr:catalase [Thermoleophilaceae bacterium]
MLSPDQAIDGINKRFGRHAGARALHAKGLQFAATFTATPQAGRLTRAAHMQGQPVDATVRLSNGSGDPRSPDYDLDVRGMATTFHLPDGSNTDISAQTAPRFPVRTPDDFVKLVQATEPGLRGISRLLAFVATHPGAMGAVRANAEGLKPPASLASRRYYAIHAFKWIDGSGGERHVRYTWVPEREEPPLGIREAKSRGRDYLQEEIRERLGREPARFVLSVQIAGDGDDVDDPTSVWPRQRETVTAGTLELTGLRDGADERVYDPARVTDGIELSNDPILAFRPRAYSVSAERRLG